MWEITWASCSPATGVMGEGNSENGRMGGCGQWQNLSDGRKCQVWLDFSGWFILWRVRTYVNLDNSCDSITHWGTNCHEQTHLEVGWGERDGVRMVNMKALEVLVGSQVTPRSRAFYIKVEGHVHKPYWKSEMIETADISCSDKDKAYGSWSISWTLVVTWWVGVWVVLLRVQFGATSDGIYWLPELYPDTEKLTSLWGCRYFLLFPPSNNVSEFGTFLYYLTFNKI